MNDRRYTLTFSKFLDRISGLSDEDIFSLLLHEAQKNIDAIIDVPAAAVLPFEEAYGEQVIKEAEETYPTLSARNQFYAYNTQWVYTNYSEQVWSALADSLTETMILNYEKRVQNHRFASSGVPAYDLMKKEGQFLDDLRIENDTDNDFDEDPQMYCRAKFMEMLSVKYHTIPSLMTHMTPDCSILHSNIFMLNYKSSKIKQNSRRYPDILDLICFYKKKNHKIDASRLKLALLDIIEARFSDNKSLIEYLEQHTSEYVRRDHFVTIAQSDVRFVLARYMPFSDISRLARTSKTWHAALFKPTQKNTDNWRVIYCEAI
jgi:hypothetical protein